MYIRNVNTNTHGGEFCGVVGVGVGVSVGGEVPPLNVQFAQLTDDARVAHHHHGPGEYEIQNY